MSDIFYGFRNFRDKTVQNLLTVLRDNCNTEYGKQYDFSSIHSVEEYRNRIPLVRYADIADSMEREIKSGNTLTSYRRRFVVKSSGTTGKQKSFVLTEKTVSCYEDIVYNMPYLVLGEENKGNNLQTNIFRLMPDDNTILSIAYYINLREKKHIDGHSFVEGFDLLYNEYAENQPYVKLRALFSNPETAAIYTTFSNEAYMMFRYLKNNWQMILADVKNNTVSVDLDEKTAVAIKKLPQPNKEWLIFAEEEMKKGFDTPIVPRLWKKIKFVSGITIDAYQYQVQSLKKYIGDIPIFYMLFGGSECITGIPTEFNKGEYAMIAENGFYELLTLGEKTAIFPWEAKIGETYELVLTTFSGLYRYLTNDLIKIVGFEGESPKFTFEGRTTEMLNICGEKIDRTVLTDSVAELFENLKIDAEDFTVGVGDMKYEFVLELKSGKVSAETVADEFDRILKKNSPDYEDIRRLGSLEKPEAVFVKSGAHSACMDYFLPAVSHRKKMLVINEEQLRFLLERRVRFDG